MFSAQSPIVRPLTLLCCVCMAFFFFHFFVFIYLGVSLKKLLILERPNENPNRGKPRSTTRFQKFCVPEMRCISVYYTQLRNKNRFATFYNLLARLFFYFYHRVFRELCLKHSFF